MTMPISVCRPHTFLSARAGRQHGFTLLEILLVVAIMAIAAVMVVPGVGSLDARNFDARVREAHTLLNYARRTAVVRGQPASIAFVTSSEDEQTGSIARDNIGQWHSDAIELAFLDSKEMQTEVEQVLQVTFYPEGGSSGGTLRFEQEGQFATIFIDPFTGRIERLDPDDETDS